MTTPDDQPTVVAVDRPTVIGPPADLAHPPGTYQAGPDAETTEVIRPAPVFVPATSHAYVRPDPTRRDRRRALRWPFVLMAAASLAAVLAGWQLGTAALDDVPAATLDVPPSLLLPIPTMATPPPATTQVTPRRTPAAQPPPAAVPTPPAAPTVRPSPSPPPSTTQGPCIPPLTTCTPTPGGDQ